MAEIGGDILGARILALHGTCLKLAGASVIADKLNEALSQVPCTLLGLGLLVFLRGATEAGHRIAAGLIVAAAALLSFGLAQRAGLFRLIERLLIVTFDEDDKRDGNHIVTLFFGDHVKPGRYGERISHYSVPRTLQAMYGFSPLARSAAEQPIRDIWRSDADRQAAGPLRP